MVLLNPSRADARREDPTVRRCLGFARRDGFGALYVLNIFAWRTPFTRELRAARAPVGRLNDRYIAQAAHQADQVAIAWGAHGEYLERAAEVLKLLSVGRAVWCLGRTHGGHPRHPLYLKRSTPFEPYPVFSLPEGRLAGERG